MEREAIVYGTDRPRLLAGRTLLATSGPTYDSVRVYGIWLPMKPLLVTVSGIATGDLTVAWEYPWREQTTEVWRNAVIRSAMQTRHNHRHGLRPSDNSRAADHRRPPGHRTTPVPPHRNGHAAYPSLDHARHRTILGDSRPTRTARRTDPGAGSTGVAA